MVYPKIDTIKHAYDWQHPSNSYFLAAIPINLISVVSSLTAREPSASLVTSPLPNRLLWITGNTAPSEPASLDHWVNVHGRSPADLERPCTASIIRRGRPGL